MTPEQDELYLKVWVVGCHVTDSWATPPWWPEALDTRYVLTDDALMHRVWGDPDADERTEPETRALKYWEDLTENDELNIAAEIETVFLHRDPSDMSQPNHAHETECISVWVTGRFVFLKTHPDVDPDAIPWDAQWPAYQWEPRAEKYLVTTEGCDDKTYAIVELTPTELKVVQRVSAAINVRADGCHPYLHVKPFKRANKFEIEEATEERDE